MQTPVIESLGARVRRYVYLWVVLGIVVVLLGGYAAGFRMGPGLTVVRVGTLIVKDIPAGTAVYADQASRGIASGGPLHMSLVPGTHTIIVAAPNMEPWEKAIQISSSETTTISPILVPMKPTALRLSEPEAGTARALAAAIALPTEQAPLILGCAAVYVSQDRVIAGPATTTPGCQMPPDFLCSAGSCEPTIIYTPPTPIRAIIPFPERTDAVIVSTGTWTYALGLDPRYPQYFAPVVQGAAPLIATGSSTSFYFIDSGNAFRIEL